VSGGTKIVFLFSLPECGDQSIAFSPFFFSSEERGRRNVLDVFSFPERPVAVRTFGLRHRLCGTGDFTCGYDMKFFFFF